LSLHDALPISGLRGDLRAARRVRVVHGQVGRGPWRHDEGGRHREVKINDAVWGALLLLFSAVLLVHVQSFPKIPGQQVGPALFPGILAVALGVCSVLLVIKGLAARRAVDDPEPWVELDDWTSEGRYVVAFVITIGVNVFYIL